MLRRLLPLLLLFVFSFWTVASAAEDALTIVFSANSGGEYEPCPVCGGKALGGLGRRATAFDALRATADDHTLFLAGPNEFQPPRGLQSPTVQLANALSKAYATLDYNAIFCSPEEERWLRGSGADLPKSLHAVSNRAQVQILRAGDVTVGVVVFPRLLKGAGKPSHTMIASVARKARNMAERVDVVIGVSPWGASGEAAFLAESDPVFDLLLGAGPGPGLAGRFVEDGKTFWARAYTMGKAFHVIRITDLPRREADWKWIKNENLHLDFKILDKNVSQNGAMVALLNEFHLSRVK